MPNNTGMITGLCGRAMEQLTNINLSCLDLKQSLEEEPFNNCIKRSMGLNLLSFAMNLGFSETRFVILLKWL